MTPALPPLRSVHVLLIDDSDDDREAYRRVLTRSGFVVQEAADPWSAYQQAIAEPPALIVADIGMPGPLNGIELTRKFKSNQATRAIPIIALTGYSDDDTRTDSLRAGAAVFLTKPCAPDVLLAAIKRLLAPLQS